MEWTSLEGARQFFYHDCDEATVRWAFEHLSPGISPFPEEKLFLPRLWQAQPSRSYIRCLEDRSKPLAMSREVVRRLGVEELTIASSHSPFLSKPVALAALLVRAVGTKAEGPLLPE
jgi:hypothetical protein